MISFQFSLTTGPIFSIQDKPDEYFHTVLSKFLMRNNLTNIKIDFALNNGTRIDMNKTLEDNNIIQGSNVVLKAEMSDDIILNTNNFQNINQNIVNGGQPIIPKVIPYNNLNNMNGPINYSNYNNLNNNNFIYQNPPNNYIINKNKTIPIVDTIQPISNILYNNNFKNINFNNHNHNSNNNNFNNNKLNLSHTPTIDEAKYFLTDGCNVPEEFFDSEGDCEEGWNVGRKNGPPGYLKDYYAPVGWTGIGLKAYGLYDNGDNTWIENKNVKGEWYIAYHPIKSTSSIKGILYNGFRRGPFQGYKDDNNLNPLTNNKHKKIGKGVYFLPDIDEAKDAAKSFKFSGKNYKAVFMCRINPKKVRIAEYGSNKEIWVVNGDKLEDPNGQKKDNEVRTYRILVILEN